MFKAIKSYSDTRAAAKTDGDLFHTDAEERRKVLVLAIPASPRLQAEQISNNRDVQPIQGVADEPNPFLFCKVNDLRQ